jgi:hypothetical protein
MSDREDDVRKPLRSAVIAKAIEAFARRLPVSVPAKVVRVDANKRCVDCKVLVMRPFFDESDERQVESIPVIPSVPLSLPPFYAPPISDGTLTFGGSILPATTGMLIWCDRSIDRWLTGNGREVDPEIDHDHALADAWFVPGLFAYGAVPFALPQSYILAGSSTVGADYVALAQKVDDLNNALRAAITAGKSAVTPQDGGFAAFTALDAALKPPALTYTWPTSVAATEFKAK